MRTWLVIPALAATGSGSALCVRHTIPSAAAIGIIAAALGAAIRAMVGPSLAAAVSSVMGSLLGVFGILSMWEPPIQGVRFALGGAAAMFAIYELARAKPRRASPFPAVGAALLASACDPTYAPMVAVTGAFLVASERTRTAHRRWVLGLPVVGGLATAVAVALATSVHYEAVWRAWSGVAGEPMTAADALDRCGTLLGPIAACACLFGLGLCVIRDRYSGSAVAALVGMIAVTILSNGAVPPAFSIITGLCAGVAIGRFSSTVHSSLGQAFVSTTSGFVLVVGSAWPWLFAM